MDLDTASSPQPHDTNQVTLADEQPAPSHTYNGVVNIAFATAAGRAASLASHEEREMTRLVGAAVNLTLQKLELKLAQFSEMEAVLQAERQELDRGKRQLFLDRLAFKKRMREVQEGLRKAAINGQVGGVGMGAEDKLGFMAVTGRAEEDIRPLGVGDEGFRGFEV